MTTLTADNYRDAVAFIRATYQRDVAGREAIARNCDPAGMVDAITMLYLGMLTSVQTEPLEYFDEVLIRLDAVLGDDR